MECDKLIHILCHFSWGIFLNYTLMPWQRAWYNLDIRKISWLVQRYTPWKVKQDVNQFYTFRWLCLNAYSYSLVYSQTAIFSAALWVKDHSSAEGLETLAPLSWMCLSNLATESLEALRLLLRKRVAATLTRAPESSRGEKGSIRYRGICSFLFSIARTKFSSGSCPIAMDNRV